MSVVSVDKLRARLDAHEAFLRGEGDSVPPRPVLREPEPLTPERCAEIGAVLKRHGLLGMFGVTVGELDAFCAAAKRGVAR